LCFFKLILTLHLNFACTRQSIYNIFFHFKLAPLVDLIGEGQGNVIVKNRQTGVTGSICGDYWSITNVSSTFEIYQLEHRFLTGGP